MIQKTPLKLDINNLPDVIDLELTEDVYERCGEYGDCESCPIGTLLQEAGLQASRIIVLVTTVMLLNHGVERYFINRVGDGKNFNARDFNARWTGIIRLERI